MLYKYACQIHFCDNVPHEHIKKINLPPFYVVTGVGKHGSKRHGVRVEKGEIRME
jgi:hypothetical protein